MDIRNVAVIAHVDHGKTTLVDGLLKQSKTFRENEPLMTQDLILDSNDQERERGITILAKNASVMYKGIKINIIDTPGHADFSGEVERTLNMADGALLLVDAQEGPMPQTKFVLRKALELGLRIIVVVNKIDKKDAHLENTLKNIDKLFLELATVDDQLDFHTLFAISREGKSWKHYPKDTDEKADLTPIFEAIVDYIPSPKTDDNAPFQMMVSSLDWDNHKGKYSIGRIKKGSIHTNDQILLLNAGGKEEKVTIDKIFMSEGLKKVETSIGLSGDIVSLTGIPNAEIGDTLSSLSHPEIIETIKIGEPTLNISIGANTSPFAGREGTFLTSRQILKRIEKELQTNVAMKFNIDENGRYILSGRGELHLCVFLETLSREGYEFEVGKPKVITKVIDGVELEPLEEYTIDVDDEYVGAIQGELGRRRGILVSNSELLPGHTRLIFEIPTRGVLGLNSILQTLSRGTAITNSDFLRYEKISGTFNKLRKGVLIAFESGTTASYGLRVAQDKGPTLVPPQTPVYQGQIIGINGRDSDLEVNVCKTRVQTNMRATATDTGIMIDPPMTMSLEQYFGFIENDELLEITPKSMRLRKKILDSTERFRDERKNKSNSN